MPTEEDKYFYFKQNQEKKIVTKRDTYDYENFPSYGKFSDIKSFFNAMEEKYSSKPDAIAHINGDYDGCVSLGVTWKEMETDDEFETRCRKEFFEMQEIKRKNREYNEARRIKKLEKNERRRLKRIEKEKTQENLTNLLIKSRDILTEG